MSAGYSGTAQARKLGLKPGMRVRLDDAPKGWRLEAPPQGVELVRGTDDVDVVIAFFRTASRFADRIDELAQTIPPDGAIWVAWPRRAAGHESDLNGDVIREHALPIGIVDNKVAAIDEDWSGLRLVWRLTNR